MTIKASGRSALILATGLFACLATASQATAVADNSAAGSKSESAATAPVTSSKYAKHWSHHGKTYAHRRSSHLALKFPGDRKADEAADQAAIPTSVANANAAMTPADTPASAMSLRAGEILQATADNAAVTPPAAETQIVAADQLNDVDRALQEGQPPAANTTTADAPAEPTAQAAPIALSRNDGSSWDQASLIGKIFIAFGGLLTAASAARMFMT
jgi:hypothetical protein